MVLFGGGLRLAIHVHENLRATARQDKEKMELEFYEKRENGIISNVQNHREQIEEKEQAP